LQGLANARQDNFDFQFFLQRVFKHIRIRFQMMHGHRNFGVDDGGCLPFCKLPEGRFSVGHPQ
jgi:hypothetical protein